MSQFEDQFITSGGIRTRYWSVGEGGIPLALLHGLSGTIEDWSETLPALSENRRVVAIDLLGSGKTSKPADCTYAPDTMRDHVLDVLDALSLNVVDMSGWSLGGRIALDIACAAPHRLRRLVLTAPAGIGSDTMIDFSTSLPAVMGQAITRPGASGLRILLNAIHSGNSSRLASFSARRISLFADIASRKAFIGQLKSFVGPKGFLEGPRHDLLAKLPMIQTPTLAVWGRNDNLSPFHHSAVLVDLMPHCALQVVKHCGHAPQIEWPDIYTGALRSFLDGSLAGGTSFL
ncbi:alpha/beta fold hydrolase [Loktanella sp. M215]|uniref:alpha/beta fold hydrolase n=1 Tax=Loktanella sp. M215 TaxID=2675431 RepID=UPI001F472598|nr:alpha/beta hydrolase [Loktanella sp. M215]MCF7701885.1 alpha/beta fold hydrolase [Loktanella sp. M215]